MRVGVIGGGAAGYFSAIQVAERYPEAAINILERSSKVLAKVGISGGGRCNVTNGELAVSKLIEAYPRGRRIMKKGLRRFSTTDIMTWFEDRGVPLYVQKDGRVFPKSNSSDSIVDCFLTEVKKRRIETKLNHKVAALNPSSGGIEVVLNGGENERLIYDKIIVATGGSPKKEGLKWLADLGHAIVDPVPSLFTFNMPREEISRLMGVSVSEVLLSIQGSKLRSRGPLLITHWGISGPAVLKLSALAARELHESDYTFTAQVNWTGITNDQEVSLILKDIISQHSGKRLASIRPFGLPQRLWTFLVEKMGFTQDRTWGELGKKRLNKIVYTLCNDSYSVEGKTTFKEEFVTCGGVSEKAVNVNTLESLTVKNLFFAGEVLDIDAVTGGYNFQAAWTTGYVAAHLGDI